MRMYPKNDIYETYKKNLVLTTFSSVLPDLTKKITLEHMNYAINVCDKWDTAMDIGGGTGHYLTALVDRFKRAILVEVETLPEHTTITAAHKNLEVVHAYIEKYERPEKIDFILLADLFEHIPDIKSFVAQLARLQDAGGVVYMMTPNPIYCGPAPESGLYHTRHPNGHIKQYSQHEIIALMKEAGYQLALALCEEAPLRQKVKHVLFALSRRDKQWNASLLYQLIRPLFLLVALPLFWLAEKITYASEKRNRYNVLTTMTQDLVFKKV